LCTHPSADSAPRRLDLDLPFSTLWFGYLFKTQVFSAVETHGVHEFFRRHGVLAAVFGVFDRSRSIASFRFAGNARTLDKTRLCKMCRGLKNEIPSSTIIQPSTVTKRATTPHAVLPLPALAFVGTANAMLSTEHLWDELSRPRARMPQFGHAKVTCLAYYADEHVPLKRDAFNGKVRCGVSRGQGSGGVFVLLLEGSFGITVKGEGL